MSDLFTLTAGQLVGLVVSLILGSTVLSQVVSGLFAYFRDRRNAKLAEANAETATDDTIIKQYREAAEESRLQKDSAVSTVTQLLTLAKGQIDTLNGIIERLTATIESMSHAAVAQQATIDLIVAERDALKEAKEATEAKVAELTQELLDRQETILGLTYPKAEIDKLREGATS